MTDYMRHGFDPCNTWPSPQIRRLYAKEQGSYLVQDNVLFIGPAGRG